MKKIFAAAALVALCAATAWSAPKYPRMAITLNTHKAGTSVDTNARILARYLNKELKTNVIVNNTSSQLDAARTTMNAAPDGYTIGFVNNSAIIRDVVGATDFNTVEDMDIVATVTQGFASWIAIRAEDAQKWNVYTLKDLFAYCEQHPGELLISSQRNTNTGVAVSQLISAGLKVTPADVGSTGDRLTNFLAGTPQIFVGAYQYIRQYVQMGEVVCLASCSRVRSKYSPDVPCTFELGYEVTFPSVYYVMIPKGAPQEAIDTLSAAIKKICENPKYVKDLEKSAQEPFYQPYGEAAKYLADMKQNMISLGMGPGYQKK